MTKLSASTTEQNETIQFAMYLTGHDIATIEQMYEDWIKQEKWLKAQQDIWDRDKIRYNSCI